MQINMSIVKQCQKNNLIKKKNGSCEPTLRSQKQPSGNSIGTLKLFVETIKNTKT